MNPHSCIACSEDRAKGSGFCKAHRKAHNSSAWVKAWKKYQIEVDKKGVKNVLWAAPAKEK